MYTIYNTYKFVLKKLNKKALLVPYFTHNAIPCNINDIKEMYDIVYNSEFKSSTLDSLFRGLETLQFQTFYMSYIFNKYTKKEDLLTMLILVMLGLLLQILIILYLL